MKSIPILSAATILAASVGAVSPSPAIAATLSRSCTVDNVAVFDNRIHIKCLPVPGVGHTQAIFYFALPITEPAVKIQSIITLATEAMRSNRRLTIWFDMDDYASVPGCQGSDCRRLQGVALE